MIGKIKPLYQKYREMISYVFFGGLTTVVSIAVHYAVIFWVTDDTAIATTVSWICSVTFAFFVNKIFVFKSVSEKKSDWFKQGMTFYGARVTTYLLELGFMLLTVRALQFDEYIMKLVAQVFILAANYLLSKFWVFKKKKEK
ncbi:MAG: GtrA family protein [Oscillospiraceae bacterium]|nr:GtrA family protein [Oscillospiraceae bacterium]